MYIKSSVSVYESVYKHLDSIHAKNTINTNIHLSILSQDVFIFKKSIF